MRLLGRGSEPPLHHRVWGNTVSSPVGSTAKPRPPRAFEAFHYSGNKYGTLPVHYQSQPPHQNFRSPVEGLPSSSAGLNLPNPPPAKWTLLYSHIIWHQLLGGCAIWLHVTSENASDSTVTKNNTACNYARIININTNLFPHKSDSTSTPPKPTRQWKENYHNEQQYNKVMGKCYLLK